jgi:adenine-specific DNA-methyltransferase
LRQNINYIGSKYSILNFIYYHINENIKDLKTKTFCDIFSGTNIVSIYFKNKVKKLIVNDIEYFSYILSKTYLSNSEVDNNKLQEILVYLNNIKGVKSDFYNYYCENGEYNRLYFSEKNGMKINGIRNEIENLKNNDEISIYEYHYLLISLLESSDKVANTTSVYSAFLKKIKKSANNPILLKPLNIHIIKDQKNDIYMENSNTLVSNLKGDIIYIDPPYNHRQYGSNYHILNTILKNEYSITPKGVTGLMDYYKSKYCMKTYVKDTFNELINNINFKHVFLSYNNEGLMGIDDIINILSEYGKIKLYKKPHKSYKSDSKRVNKSKNTIEYLFYLKKD